MVEAHVGGDQVQAPVQQLDLLKTPDRKCDARRAGLFEPLPGDCDHLRRCIDGCDRRFRVSTREADREGAGAAAQFEDVASLRGEAASDLLEHLRVAGHGAPSKVVVLAGDRVEVGGRRLHHRVPPSRLRPAGQHQYASRRLRTGYGRAEILGFKRNRRLKSAAWAAEPALRLHSTAD